MFAALEIATGVVYRPDPRAAPGEADFLAFLRRLARAYPAGEVHVILDNVSTHKTPASSLARARNRGLAFTSPPPARRG